MKTICHGRRWIPKRKPCARIIMIFHWRRGLTLTKDEYAKGPRVYVVVITTRELRTRMSGGRLLENRLDDLYMWTTTTRRSWVFANGCFVLFELFGCLTYVTSNWLTCNKKKIIIVSILLIHSIQPLPSFIQIRHIHTTRRPKQKVLPPQNQKFKLSIPSCINTLRIYNHTCNQLYVYRYRKQPPTQYKSHSVAQQVCRVFRTCSLGQRSRGQPIGLRNVSLWCVFADAAVNI